MVNLLNVTISTQRPAVTQDAQGTSVEDWTTPTVIDANVPASIQQLSQREIAAFSRRNVDGDVEVYTRVQLAAKLNDRLVGPGPTYYTIVAVNDEAGRGRIFRTVCKQLGVGS